MALDRQKRLEAYLDRASEMGLAVHEEKLQCHDGLLIGRDIIIREDLPTLAKKADVMAEEIAHAELTVGNILDQTDSNNRRQEHKARFRAAQMRVPLDRIIDAYIYGCRNSYEAAEYLDVSEDTFLEALELYRQAFGPVARIRDYVVRFEPTLAVYRVIMFG